MRGGMRIAMPWSPEEVDAMRRLAGEGHSASQIAARLNAEFHAGRSRNAVIGKIERGRGRFGALQIKPPYRGSPRLAPAKPRSRLASPAPRKKNAVALPPAAAKTGAASPHRAAPVDPRPSASPPVASTALTLPPMRFADAVAAERCLHFVGDPLSADGPDMAVCGAERAHDASPRNRYCPRHLRSQGAGI